MAIIGHIHAKYTDYSMMCEQHDIVICIYFQRGIENICMGKILNSNQGNQYSSGNPKNVI